MACSALALIEELLRVWVFLFIALNNSSHLILKSKAVLYRIFVFVRYECMQAGHKSVYTRGMHSIPHFMMGVRIAICPVPRAVLI